MKVVTAWWRTLCTATSVALWLHTLMPKWKGVSDLPRVSVLKQKPLFAPLPAVSEKPMVTVSFSSPAHLKQTSLIFQSLFSGLLLGCETLHSCLSLPRPGRANWSSAALSTQHPALAQPFLEQHPTVDSCSVHGWHPELLFCSTAAWPLSPHFLFVLLISSS